VTTLLLVRHGETDWNRDGRWQGHSDTHLNDTGREQARGVAAALPDVDVIYASDLARACETAEIIAAELGRDVRTDARLRERAFGSWEGLSAPEIDEQFGEELARWRVGDGAGAVDAEPFEAFARRIHAFLDDVLAAHPDETVLVVSHGGAIRVIHALARGLDYVRDHRSIPGVANCAVSKYAAKGGKLTSLD
jgi:broad specificity phosphatase PhoE